MRSLGCFILRLCTRRVLTSAHCGRTEELYTSGQGICFIGDTVFNRVLSALFSLLTTHEKAHSVLIRSGQDVLRVELDACTWRDDFSILQYKGHTMTITSVRVYHPFHSTNQPCLQCLAACVHAVKEVTTHAQTKMLQALSFDRGPVKI